MKNQIENKSDTTQIKESFSTVEIFVSLLIRWRKILILIVVICMMFSALVAFLIPPKFKSTISVLPAEKTDLFGAIEGISSQIKSLSSARNLASLAGNPELDKYIIILKSGRVLGAVINKFDLIKVYGITSYPMEKASQELLGNIDFSTQDNISLTITVYDEDPVRAADMANFFVDELSRTNTDLQVQNARANKGFIEERYEQNMKELASAEDSLRVFQKRYGIISMPEQTEASIKATAELTGQLALKEIQLEVEKRMNTSDHPSVIVTRLEIEEIRKKIQQMNSSQKGDRGLMKVFVPFAEIPDLGAEYLRRYRNVEIQYKILQFITPIFEQAKVEEMRSTPSVVVLDRAFPAERKAKPKRLYIILGGIFIGFISTFAFAIIHDRWIREKAANSLVYQSLSRLGTSIQDDLKSLWSRMKRTRI